MPIDPAVVKNYEKKLAPEGAPKILLAPLAAKDIPPGLPPEWTPILTSADSAQALLDGPWKAVAAHLPKTTRAMKKRLKGAGLLTSRKRPPSLLYVFTCEDGDRLIPWRGYPPAREMHPQAAKLPPEFIDFYKVHDGWAMALSGAMGPQPMNDWAMLEDDPTTPAGQFLVVFNDGAGGRVGFDMRKSKPTAHVVWTDDKPESVPMIWGELDPWIKEQLTTVDDA